MSWNSSKKIGRDPPAVQRKLKVKLQNFLRSHALVILPSKELFCPHISGPLENFSLLLKKLTHVKPRVQYFD